MLKKTFKFTKEQDTSRSQENEMNIYLITFTVGTIEGYLLMTV